MSEKPAKKKTGRPTKRTKKLIDDMLAWVAAGKTIRKFCQENGIHSAQIYRWAKEDRDLSQQLAHAREVGALEIEDEILEIADEGDESNVQHRKLQLWAREKRLIWNNPAKYGTKVGIGAAAGLPPIQLSETERVVRIKQLLGKAAEPKVTVEIDPAEE